MKKNLVVILLAILLLLPGCGTREPEADPARLDDAYEQAKTALETAEEEGATDHVSKKYAGVYNKFEDVRRQHRDAPSSGLIPEYQKIQIEAHRVAIETLKSRLQDFKNKINQLQENREEKKEQIADREEEISQLRQKSSEYSREYEQSREQLNDLRQTLAEQEQLLARYRRERNEMQEEVERYRHMVNDLERELEQAEDQIVNLQDRLDKKSERVSQLRAENEAIVEDFEDKLEEGAVRVEDRGVVVNLQSKILFEMAEARLKRDARKLLRETALVLHDYPDREIRVDGHTCDLPIKKAFASNWELSAHRAIEVLKYLVYAHNLEPDRISAAAYGHFRPLVPNNSEENRRKNRRVEITLLPPELPEEEKSLVEDY